VFPRPVNFIWVLVFGVLAAVPPAPFVFAEDVLVEATAVNPRILVDLRYKTSDYDEFSEKAHRGYYSGAPQERQNRQILEQAMEKEGLRTF
jgi:D-alanyl-D-alanine dipeptidase